MGKIKTGSVGVGHNSGASPERVRAFVQRIEKAELDRREAATFVSGIYAEAKADGFDCKTLRRIVRDRQKTEQERAEEAALLDLYKSAIGME